MTHYVLGMLGLTLILIFYSLKEKDELVKMVLTGLIFVFFIGTLIILHFQSSNEGFTGTNRVINALIIVILPLTLGYSLYWIYNNGSDIIEKIGG